jgi:hypothetical protein
VVKTGYLPDSAIALGEGFALATRWRTFSRWQRALPGRAEFPLLVEDAERQAAQRPPHPHRMLVAIVRRIDASADDEAGRRTQAVSEMSPDEIEYCRGAFAEFTHLVFVFTGGALRVEATELVLEEPARRLSSIGKGRYWLSAADAFAGRESTIPPDQLDSIAVYYKLPHGIVPGLHGGAIGRDHAASLGYFTLWVSHWDELLGPFNRTVIASLHEWLHNVTSAPIADGRRLSRTATPARNTATGIPTAVTHSGRRGPGSDAALYPREFWYRLASRNLRPRRPLPNAPLAVVRRRAATFRSPGLYRRPTSPPIDAATAALEDRSAPHHGPARSQVSLRQSSPNTPVVWALQTSTPVESPCASGNPLHVPPALDNVLSLARLPAPGPVDDPVAPYTEAPLESMAWLRSPLAERGRRDLLLLRVDVAPWLLPRLRVVGRPAADSLAGYLSRNDPSEGQPLNLLVAAVDLGDPPPRDELAACGA